MYDHILYIFSHIFAVSINELVIKCKILFILLTIFEGKRKNKRTFEWFLRKRKCLQWNFLNLVHYEKWCSKQMYFTRLMFYVSSSDGDNTMTSLPLHDAHIALFVINYFLIYHTMMCLVRYNTRAFKIFEIIVLIKSVCPSLFFRFIIIFHIINLWN